MKSLYHIKTEYQQLLNTLEELQGELSPELEEALSINESELQEKALNYVRILSELEAEISYGQAEIERAEAYVSGKKRVVSFLKERLLEAVKLHGPIQAGTRKISIRESESVQIEDEEKLTEPYVTKKLLIYPNKIKIREHIKLGMSVAGAELVKNQSLAIK